MALTPQLEQMFLNMGQATQSLQVQLQHQATSTAQQIQALTTALSSKSAASGLPACPAPRSYDGKCGADLERWNTEMQVVFRYRLGLLGVAMSDAHQVIVAQSHLAGFAQEFASRLSPAATDYAGLLDKLRAEYQPIGFKTVARKDLHTLVQGSRPVHEYAQEFRRLLAIVGSTDTDDAVFRFCNGLKRPLADYLLYRATPPTTVDEAVSLAARKEGIGRGLSGASSGSGSGVQAMDLSAAQELPQDDSRMYSAAEVTALLNAMSTRNERGYGKPRYDVSNGVSPEEIARRRAERLCYHCGSADHIKRECPKASTGGASGSQPISSKSKSKNGSARQ